MTVSVRAACEYRHRPLKKDIKRKGGERAGNGKKTAGAEGEEKR